VAILNALQKNDFLKYSERFDEMVSCMSPEVVEKDTVIIKEGDLGSKAYVIEGQIHKLVSNRGVNCRNK
jgi:hypothetical protein